MAGRARNAPTASHGMWEPDQSSSLPTETATAIDHTCAGSRDANAIPPADLTDHNLRFRTSIPSECGIGR
jgi:hypothetical protein